MAAAQRLGLREALMKGLIAEETYQVLRDKLGCDEGGSEDIAMEVVEK